MKKLPRIIIFIFTTLLVISILVFIYCFADKLTDFSFANVVLEFYILFIAYLFFVLMLFDKMNEKNHLVLAIVFFYFIQFASLIIATGCNGEPHLVNMTKAFTVVSHVFEYFITACFINYVLLFLNKSKLARYFYIYFIIISIVAILFSFTGNYYFMVDENRYVHRGSLYFLSYIFTFAPSISVIIMLLISNKVDYKKKALLSLFQFVPIIGDILNIWFLKINYEPIFASFALVILYFSMALERTKNIENQETIIAKQKKELEEGEISILLSSIQPHFLYNSLSSIMSLCTENPQEASDTIADFADYLRLNLDSLKERKLISFEKELEHTEIYLKLQKLRFKEKLNVIYNINVKDFYIPAITLQPLVENACKHGIFKKKEGGTIIIETNEVDNFYEIKVIDDGVGFNQIIDNGKTHTGIKNVKNRISILVNGIVDVTSKVGQGTVAKIYIPMEVKNENSCS